MDRKINRRDFIKLGAGTAGAVIIAGVSGCIGGGNGSTETSKKDMTKYECQVCEKYTYDPEKGEPDQGVAAGTPWSDVPDDFTCPVCGNPKSSGEWEKVAE